MGGAKSFESDVKFRSVFRLWGLGEKMCLIKYDPVLFIIPDFRLKSRAESRESRGKRVIFNRSGFNRSGFNSPKLASFLIHKVYIKCLGACPEDLYFDTQSDQLPWIARYFVYR